MATFKILDTFSITNRGFVLLGDITNGTITKGDFASIPKANTSINLEILGVEMADFISERVAHVGLVISKADSEKITDITLKGMEVEIVHRPKSDL